MMYKLKGSKKSLVLLY